MLFEMLDSLRKRRLADRQGTRRTAEMPLFRQSDQILKVLELHADLRKARRSLATIDAAIK
jgi:hypothetical protein